MSKQRVKIIKRADGKSKAPSPKKEKPKKKRSLESTVKDWITERREDTDTRNRTLNAQLADWNDETTPSKAP